MKKFISIYMMCFLILTLCASAAFAEDSVEKILSNIDVKPIQNLADQSDAELDVQELVINLARADARWDAEWLFNELSGIVIRELKNMSGLFIALIAPLLIWALMRQLTDGAHKGAAEAAGYVCYLTAATSLLTLFAEQVSQAQGAISQISRLTEQLFPILTAMLVATGATATAAIFTPAAALASGMVAAFVYRLALVLSTCAAALVVAGYLHERIKLKGLTDLIISGGNWTMGICMTAFIGFMTVQGILGSGYDNVSIRTARYTVDNLLPIIGGEVADTMDVMVASAGVVKNAVGVTGMILMLTFCLRPLIHILATIVVVKISSALVEPIAEGPIQKLTGSFSGVLSMLLVALVTCMVIFMVLIGAVLVSGRIMAGG